MKRHKNKVHPHIGTLLFWLAMVLGYFDAFAADNAQLISVSIQPGTQIMPRTMFTQTWTFTNTGTTTWTPTQAGFTLNLVGLDSLGAVRLYTNTHASWYSLTAIIGSGSSVPPGGKCTYSMAFIAPEAAGTYTDTFQLNNANSVFFGPQVTIQITVPQAGSTNQFDRSKAISYANNDVGYVCTDGYFWNSSAYSNLTYYGVGSPVPTNVVGDDCAHFVSCCIGSQSSSNRGGGLNIITRAAPSYGEPGAQRLIYTNLIGGGYAVEVHSLSQMEPGDVVGWNWNGNSDPALIDHVTLYMGNGLCSAHATSHLDVSMSYYLAGSPTPAYHLIHILDAPTVASTRAGTNLILSWGTNWTGYSLYSSTSLANSATWTKVSKTPTTVGKLKFSTNTISSGAKFYRLMLPGP